MATSASESGWRRFQKIFSELLTETWLGVAFVIPTTILLLVILFYPTLRGIWLSFFTKSLLHPEQTQFVGLGNYQQLFADSSFWIAFQHTIIVTVVGVALEYLFGLGLALTLKQKVPGIEFFRNVSLATWVLPVIVMDIIFRWMVQNDYGLINIILGALGLPTQNWFGSLTFALPLIIIIKVWRSGPFIAIALMASMQTIPNTQYEAAGLDGASVLQQFRYITLPQISYVSMIMILLNVIFTFNDFSIIYLATGGGPLQATEVLATFVYEQAFQTYALGYAASASVVMLILLIVFAAVYVKLEEVE